MKTLFTLAMILMAYTTTAQDTASVAVSEITEEAPVWKAPKWRTISFGSLSGVTVSGYFLQTLSMAISYELEKDWSINTWSGVNYNFSYNGGWASTQITANKQIIGLNVGGGMMYGAGAIGSPFPEGFYMNDLSFIVTVSKRFKLP
jgi:hypothetical protein